MKPDIALEQWRALLAVSDMPRAAGKLRKSQSAVTYQVQKIEGLLGVKAFETEGREAIFTATGLMLCSCNAVHLPRRSAGIHAFPIPAYPDFAGLGAGSLAGCY